MAKAVGNSDSPHLHLPHQGSTLPYDVNRSNSNITAIFIEKYPAEVKAFYMKRDPEDDSLALCSDMLAPEGYGEVIGGAQREEDHDTLLKRINEHKLSPETFQWYLDLRKYGAIETSGYGLGLERLVSWICGLKHVRETIPFPRMLNRLYP